MQGIFPAYNGLMIDSTTTTEQDQVAPLVSVVILAGGRSSRLGLDKSLLLLEGKPLLARTVDTMRMLSDDLVVVTNDPDRYAPYELPVRMVPDVRPGVGALMGLYSGLQAVRGEYALVVGCDMPFLSLPLLRYLISLAAGVEVIIPRIGDKVEPLHALYSRACLAPMSRSLDQGHRQIISFFGEVLVCYVEQSEIDRFDPEHLSFLNINTPQDWEMVQQRLDRP